MTREGGGGAPTCCVGEEVHATCCVGGGEAKGAGAVLSSAVGRQATFNLIFGHGALNIIEKSN